MAVAVRPDPSDEPGGVSIEAGLLFEKYSERLLGYCLHVLRNRAEAEDAVQTTFLYAHRALQRGVVPESEYAWLHAIAKNVCRWQQRTTARRRRGLTDADVDAIPDRHDGDHAGQDAVLGLNEALASIPEGQRRALLLREWHGLSSTEVASHLGMSPPATYALLTRARRSLVRAMTSRPAVSLNLGPLLLKLKGVFAGGVANATATTAVVAGLAVGGVAVGKALHAPDSGSKTSAASPATGATGLELVPAAAVPAGAGRATVQPGALPGPRGSDAASSSSVVATGATAENADAGGPAAASSPLAGTEPPSPSTAGGPPESSPPEKPAPSPITGDPPELPPPPGIELPELPIVGDLPIVRDLPIVEDLPIVGEVLSPGEENEEDGAATGPVEEILEDLPELPLPELPLPLP